MGVKHVVSLVAVAVIVSSMVIRVGVSDAEPAATESFRLMETLSKWQYPDATFHGATSSDGGVAGVVSIKCQAILTTTDSFEEVVDYYFKDLEVADSDRQRDGTFKTPTAASRCVLVQDDSQDRSVKLRTFIVNDAQSSTTIVVSRVADERETHIAWSHYRRFSIP